MSGVIDRERTAADGGAALILDLLHGFRRSKTLFTAVKMGIFDGARPDAVALARLLDACVSLGLLKRDGESYVNTEIADIYLRGSSPSAMCGYIRYSDETLYPMWHHLQSAVVEGTPRWRCTFGEERGPEVRSRVLSSVDFAMGMHGLGLLSSAAVVEAFDLSGFRSIVDLGGATGHFAATVCRCYPAARVTVVDTPQVIECARRYTPPGVHLVAADFCVDPLPPADLFVLGRILHHRSEQRGLDLLRRLHDALPDGGAVLLVEAVLDDDRAGPMQVHMHSLNMLVCTDEGRERTAEEYRELLTVAGFRQVCCRRTGTPLDGILASK